MKKILFLILAALCFSIGADAQVPWSISGVKTRFTKGLGIPVADTAVAGAGDTAEIRIRPQDGLLYYKHTGVWALVASSSAYVPYENATRNVTIGNFRVSARTLLMDSLFARGSGGAVAVTNSGTRSFGWGAGGSSEVSFYGFAGYDANRAGSYTVRSFTDKNYVDSSVALRVRYTDTAAMLAPFIQYSDTTGLFSQVVRTFGTQPIGGNKTFGNDIFVNSARIGIGAGGNTSNSVLGYNVFTANTSGTKNTAVGENALSSNVSATDNTAFGWYSLDATTGSGNTGIGSGALGTNTSGSNNTAIGFGAGEYITGSNPNTTGTNSIYIGFNTKAAANGQTNQIVIGHDAIGNGSNTVTIGNSSVTNNYFSGNVRATAFIPTGGTSSQFLKADGSLDGTSYATAASLSGYLPLTAGSGQPLSGDLYLTSTNPNLFLNNTTATTGRNWKINSFTNGKLFIGIPAVVDALELSSTEVKANLPISGTSLSMSGAGSFLGTFGVGTASPTYKLEVSGGTDYQQFRAVHTSHVLALLESTTAARQALIGFKSPTREYSMGLQTDGSFSLFDNTGSATRIAVSTSGNTLIKTTTESPNNEALQVAGSGLFTGIVTTKANSYNGFIADNTTALGGGYFTVRQNGVTAGSFSVSGAIEGNTDANIALFAETGKSIKFMTNGLVTPVLTLASTGAATFSSSVTATGFFESSDLRLKNIVKRDGDVVYFNWKNGQDNKLHIGYIAQEVKKTNPDQVKADDKGFLSVNYTEVLVEKVRSLEKQIAELQNRMK